MAETKLSTKQVYVGLALIFTLIIGGISFSWQYDRDYSTLYKDDEIIARHRFTVEMHRTYKTMDYAYQRDNCLEIPGAYLTETRCYYPDDYFIQLNRKLKGYIYADIETKEYSDYYKTIRFTPYFKYGTTGAIAGELTETFIHNKTIEDIKQFPSEYNVLFEPRDTAEYKLNWEITHLEDIDFLTGNYSDCKYEFGDIKIDFTSECDKVEYTEINKEDEELIVHFKPFKGSQELDLTLVDPPILSSKIIYDKDRLSRLNVVYGNEICTETKYKNGTIGKTCTRPVKYYLNESLGERINSITVKGVKYDHDFNKKDDILNAWNVPIGDRNFEEFGECRDYEIEKGVCTQINLTEVENEK